MAEIVITALTKAFGAHQVLRGVDLSVGSGRLAAILGASGSGKTTLLRLLCGFERADSGTVRIDGRLVIGETVNVLPERRNIGYVAQEGALFPYLSVADNIVFGLPRRQRRVRHRVGELLEMVGLPAAFADRAPHKLSGGEQQRVALARALAPAPALILLDEPFSALDAALRAETRDAVASALAAAGQTALLVTHDQPEALSMADRVGVLRDGRLIQVATPQMLYRHPADIELALFLGEANLLPGTAKDGVIAYELGWFDNTAVADGAVDVLIRPEQVRLVSGSPTVGFAARVESIRYYGHDASIKLIVPASDRPIRITARVSGHTAPRVGTGVAIAIEGDIAVFPRNKWAEVIKDQPGQVPDREII